MDAPVELEAVQFKSDSPPYFLSYAAPDLHYAARVRLYLAANGLHSWLYGGEIKQGALVFESVKAALTVSSRVLALATPLSLPSAWMDTETHSAGADKKVRPVTMVFDGSHPALMELLQTWHPPAKKDQPCFNNELLRPLESEYATHYPKRRLEKYRGGASKFLQGANSFELAVYPRRPSYWKGHELFKDFEQVIRRPG
jgi:hypothetical protein